MLVLCHLYFFCGYVDPDTDAGSQNIADPDTDPGNQNIADPDKDK